MSYSDDAFALSKEDILIIYCALGESYVVLEEFLASSEMDMVEMEMQEYILVKRANLLDLYKRMSDFLEKKNVPFVRSIYNADTKAAKPRGGI